MPFACVTATATVWLSGTARHTVPRSERGPSTATSPPGLQLSWRLRGLISSGRLGPGERLPSVRDLATRAGVNVNTARSVYRRLEHEGLVALAPRARHLRHRPRRGRRATGRAARRRGRSPRRATPASTRASWRPRSTPPPGSTSATRRPAPRTPPPFPTSSAATSAATRRELRRQIARLEAELVRIRARASPRRPRPPAAPRRSRASPTSASSSAPATRCSNRSPRSATSRRARASARSARAARVEEMAREPEEHKWQWVSSEETGDPGCKTWHVTPRYGPVGAADGLVAREGLVGMPVSRAVDGGRAILMVRTVADRAFLPAKSLFEQVGNMMILTGKTIVAAVRPPYPYGGEFVGQFLFALQLMLVSDADLDRRLRLRRARAFRPPTSSPSSARSTASAASSSSPRSASSRPS